MLSKARITLAVCLGTQLCLAQATPPGGAPEAPAAAAPEPPAPEPEPPAAAEAPPPPAPSETDSVFAELEQDLSTPGTAPAKPRAPALGAVRGSGLMNPDLALLADFAAAWFSDEDHRQTGGHDPARTGFNLQALELNARSAVDPYFRFDATVVFGEEEVELEEVYATTLDLPLGLQARFGQFLTRFGRINPSHAHAWDFADQPFAIGRVFGEEGSRGLGAELSWLVPLPWYAELVGSVTNATGEGSARSFYGASDAAVESPADLLYVAALKQFFDLHANWSLLWGVSGAFGPNANGSGDRTAVYGSDLYLKFRPITEQSHVALSWQTEVLHRRRQLPPGELLWDVSGYSQLALRFARRWGSALRYELGTPAYDLGGNVAIDPLDPEWTKTRHRASASLTHWPSEFSRFRLQGSRDMGGAGDPIWAVFMTAALVVGAHGAHTF